MAKGVLYLMTTVVPGLIKIGRAETTSFEKRMYSLEHNGYCNVTGLHRAFAIEVDDFKEKETMIHQIFEKSRVSDTELFALDVNIAIQLLSSFDGTVIFPEDETKQEIFDDATENSQSKLIPDGTYVFQKKKRSEENRIVKATAVVDNGRWTLQKGSVLGIVEDKGVSQKAKAMRAVLSIDSTGRLLDDVKLGECTPSFAGTVVMNQSSSGWTEWKNTKGQPVDIYRQTDCSDSP